MKKAYALILSLILVIMSAAVPAGAAVYSYESYYLQIELPDDVLIMTPSTSRYDAVWSEAGVSDPSEKIKEFEEMGVVAAFYEPSSQQTVTFMGKSNSETVQKFTFAGDSDEQVKDYMRSLVTVNEGVNLEIDAFTHDSVPFFTMRIKVDTEENKASEVISGTVINGQILQFDAYLSGEGEVDESFLNQVVDGVKFVGGRTVEEYQKEVRKSWIILGCFGGAVVALIVFAIVYTRKKRKREEARSKAISESMLDFREKRRSGQVDLTEEPSFIAECTYNENMVNDYILFNTWIRNRIKLIVWGISFALLIWLMYSSGATAYAVITAALAVTFVYFTYSRSEKQKAQYKKQYDVKNPKTAVFRFYNKYFTVSGIGSITDYIYPQVTEMHSYKNYILLYISSEHAVILDGDRISKGSKEELIRKIHDERVKEV